MKDFKNEDIEIQVISNSKARVNLLNDNLFIVTKMVNENGEWGIWPINSNHFIKAQYICTFKNCLGHYLKVVKVSNEESNYIKSKLIDGYEDIWTQDSLINVMPSYYGYDAMTCNNKRYNFKINLNHKGE